MPSVDPELERLLAIQYAAYIAYLKKGGLLKAAYREARHRVTEYKRTHPPERTE